MMPNRRPLRRAFPFFGGAGGRDRPGGSNFGSMRRAAPDLAEDDLVDDDFAEGVFVERRAWAASVAGAARSSGARRTSSVPAPLSKEGSRRFSAPRPGFPTSHPPATAHGSHPGAHASAPGLRGGYRGVPANSRGRADVPAAHGIFTRTTTPSAPGRLSIVSRKWLRSAIALAIARPRPVPSISGGAARKNRSKTRGSAILGIPQPESTTSTKASAPSIFSATPTVPPRGVYLIALSIRLANSNLASGSDR